MNKSGKKNARISILQTKRKYSAVADEEVQLPQLPQDVLLRHSP
jgi:hypothetical protein